MTTPTCQHDWETIDDLSAARCRECGKWRCRMELNEEQLRVIAESKKRYRDGFMSGYARAMADYGLDGPDFMRDEWNKMRGVLADDY